MGWEDDWGEMSVARTRPGGRLVVAHILRVRRPAHLSPMSPRLVSQHPCGGVSTRVPSDRWENQGSKYNDLPRVTQSVRYKLGLYPGFLTTDLDITRA